MAHILVVDDDDLILNLIESILTRAGYQVSRAIDGREMRSQLQKNSIDLILLDIRLREDHGFDLARELSETDAPPIIFVTGTHDVSNKVAGLEIGAEDYITKPFDQRELLARIGVVLRRRSTDDAPPTTYRFDGFELNLESHELCDPGGAAVSLTTMEFQILACLVRRPRAVLSRNDISILVSGRRRDRTDRTIDVIVSKLRRKIEESTDAEVDPIQTVRGAGYKFVAEVETS